MKLIRFSLALVLLSIMANPMYAAEDEIVGAQQHPSEKSQPAKSNNQGEPAGLGASESPVPSNASHSDGTSEPGKDQRGVSQSSGPNNMDGTERGSSRLGAPQPSTSTSMPAPMSSSSEPDGSPASEQNPKVIDASQAGGSRESEQNNTGLSGDYNNLRGIRSLRQGDHDENTVSQSDEQQAVAIDLFQTIESIDSDLMNIKEDTQGLKEELQRLKHMLTMVVEYTKRLDTQEEYNTHLKHVIDTTLKKMVKKIETFDEKLKTLIFEDETAKTDYFAFLTWTRLRNIAVVAGCCVLGYKLYKKYNDDQEEDDE